MFLPLGTALRTAREFWTFLAAFARALEFRTLTKWTIRFGTFSAGTILAWPRKSRTLITVAVVPGSVMARFVETRLVVPRLIEIPRAFARRAGVAPNMIRRGRIAFLPGF
jgi:hypothetical protein